MKLYASQVQIEGLYKHNKDLFKRTIAETHILNSSEFRKTKH